MSEGPKLYTIDLKEFAWESRSLVDARFWRALARVRRAEFWGLGVLRGGPAKADNGHDPRQNKYL